MLQYGRNLSGVMEQETISKNGASLKSQMSRGNKKRVLGIAIACFSILLCASFTFKSHVNSENDTKQIIGVWKVSTDQYGGGERIKIITKTRFIWTHTVNGLIVSSGAGTYTFDGENYTENIESGTQNMSSFFGKKAVVKVRFEGEKMYYTGLLAESVPLNETWERVE